MIRAHQNIRQGPRKAAPGRHSPANPVASDGDLTTGANYDTTGNSMQLPTGSALNSRSDMQRNQVTSLAKSFGRVDLVARAPQDFIYEKENVWIVLHQQDAPHASPPKRVRRT